MKRGRILNKELSNVVASMGHTDFLIVCDAGFPIPNDAWRVDLALEKDLPTTYQVIDALAEELEIEKYAFAEDIKTFNPPLYNYLKEKFPNAEEEAIAHEKILTEMAHKAKAIVRTGAFNPWGNVLLYSGVEVPRWFNKEGVVVPDYYKDRMK